MKFILLILFVISCGPSKEIVKAPKKNLDPKVAKIEFVKGEDKLFVNQWNFKSINADKVIASHQSSKIINIAMVGTGVDYNHEDLQANIEIKKNARTEESEIGADFVDGDLKAYDSFGEDTEIAGVIAAVHGNGKGIKGILKDANLIPVKYIDENGQASMADFYQAIKYANSRNPHIIYLNLVEIKFSNNEEYKKTELKMLQKVFEELEKKMIPVVVGAGNSDKEFPTSEIEEFISVKNNVIVVSSSDLNKKKFWLANYSRKFVHLLAPGKDIQTTKRGNAYTITSGSNIAAAHVVSALAYFLNKNGQKYTATELKNILLTKGIDDTNSPYVLSKGVLNLEKFVE